MKNVIINHIAFDDTEFKRKEDCQEYERDINKKIQEDFKKIEQNYNSNIIWHNGYTDTHWFNIKSMDELKTLYTWAKLEFESCESFVEEILNEDLVGHWIFVEHNDYHIYLNGTLEQYKEQTNNFKIK